MNLINCVENNGKKNIFIFVLTDLKRGIEKDIVFVIKAKPHIENAFQKLNIFD